MRDIALVIMCATMGALITLWISKRFQDSVEARQKGGLVMEITKEEKKAIATLKRLEKNWPKTIWLFATGNAINIIKCGENGSHIEDKNGTMDQKYIIDSVNINNDGGDF